MSLSLTVFQAPPSLDKKKKKKKSTNIMNIKRETNIEQVFRVESNDKLQQQRNQWTKKER